MAVGATQVALSISEAADLLGFTPSPGFQLQHSDWSEFGVKHMKTLNSYCVHILYYLSCSVLQMWLSHTGHSPLNEL